VKILTLHSNFIEFEPKIKALKGAEEVKKEKKRFEEVLVVFSAVEKTDESNPENVAKNTVSEIKDVANQIKCNNIVLYPYVHLTQTPSSPDIAKKVLDIIERTLKEENYSVSHAPFGYYKAFTISVKGHPLAELSRHISGEGGDTSTALKEEEKVKSKWFILSPDGKLTDAKKFNFKNHKNLEKFYKYEIAKVRGVTETPPHVKIMKSLQLVDYEPGSDPGNFKFYPKGRLLKSLLETWVTKKVIDYGGMEVETPLMYDYEHPALKDYLNRFPARQYTLESAKKKFFLRFSACFGQFLTAAAANISYKNLPMKIYELTRYSFRLEKAGELVGLRRLRAFTMPDMHTLCKDLEQAKKEYENQFKLCMESLKDLGFSIHDYETAIRFTKDFWYENKDFIINLVKLVNKPVLIEMWNFRYAYFDPKFEFNFVDSMGKASALSTVQIDHENGERFNILYTDVDNKRKHPLILHCSPSGSIERVIYALLEKAYLESKDKKNAVLPLWLSPVQVRLCPINDSFLKYSEEISEELEKNNIRVDIDDKSESIEKKIRNAEMEWIPYIVVIGEKEKKSGKLAVRLRETGKVNSMELKELIKLITEKTKGFPFKPLSLSKLISKRPSFI